MDLEEKYIGYLKYSGKSVETGLLDAKKSAEALLGFDEILRYFLIKEDPRLLGYDFEIPVRIKKGTWMAAIPVGVISLVALRYLDETAKKAAQEGLMSTGAMKDVTSLVTRAIKSAQWMIRIGLHKGTLEKIFDDSRIDLNRDEILIPDISGKYLPVPRKYFDLFAQFPKRLFSKNASLIEKERVLEIGVFDAGKEEKVVITDKEKSIYYTESDEGEIILPELVNGLQVELEGRITRVNEKRNTLGFEYNEHILTCVPEAGNVVTYKSRVISHHKNHFFPKVTIIGLVDRVSVDSEFKKIKPQIIFSEIISLEKEDSNLKLF